MVLPALYNALATPPLSPTNSGGTGTGRPKNARTSTTPFYSVPTTPDLSPTLANLTLGSPLVSRRTSTSTPAKINSPPPPLPAELSNPAIYEPLNSLPNSLHPAQFTSHSKPLVPHFKRYPTQLHVDTSADSLTREKKGKMPALNHLLNVGGGRVLALAADEKYVYAGCQSADNEIVVS